MNYEIDNVISLFIVQRLKEVGIDFRLCIDGIDQMVS